MEKITKEILLEAIKESNETPCMKCLLAAQAAHVACLVSAGKDPEKKKQCNISLSNAIKACPCPE